jgi:small subunit ribosomal protein S8
MTDPIADLLTRVRNAQRVGHASLEVPHSKMKEAIVKILYQEGYLSSYRTVQGKPFSILQVRLKYGPDRLGAIEVLRRVSQPGRRIYTGKDEIPPVLGGLGINILSTSKGIMTGKKAAQEGIGGEILCEIY